MAAALSFGAAVFIHAGESIVARCLRWSKARARLPVFPATRNKLHRTKTNILEKQ
jgi:hypothetical protein